MNHAELRWIEAEFTKINFVLEALWANALISHGVSPPEVDALARELRRQMLTLPGTLSTGGPAPANDEPVTGLAADRMGMFFQGVRRRIETLQDQPHRG